MQDEVRRLEHQGPSQSPTTASEETLKYKKNNVQFIAELVQYKDFVFVVV